MTAEDRAAHVEREAVAGVLAVHATFGWNGDRHHACRCGAHLNDKTWADPLPKWALHVADAVLAALPETGDAAAVHTVAHEHGMELVCSCGTLLSNYGLTRTLHSLWAVHLREVRAALTAGADQ